MLFRSPVYGGALKGTEVLLASKSLYTALPRREGALTFFVSSCQSWGGEKSSSPGTQQEREESLSQNNQIAEEDAFDVYHPKSKEKPAAQSLLRPP